MNKRPKGRFFHTNYVVKVDGKELQSPFVGAVRKDGKMALFKRSDLEAQGLTKDQIEYIMTESGRSLSANYTLNSDVQGRIDEAVKGVKPDPIDPKTTPEYQAIAKERDMLRAIGGEDFASVKPKFREQVYGMLQTGEDAKPVSEQLTGIREQYEEYFSPAKADEPKNTPQFSKQPGHPGTNPESDEDKLVKQISAQW